MCQNYEEIGSRIFKLFKASLEGRAARPRQHFCEEAFGYRYELLMRIVRGTLVIACPLTHPQHLFLRGIVLLPGIGLID